MNFCSASGAFKTLDKDNNGTIKVNVQEVNSAFCLTYHYEVTQLLAPEYSLIYNEIS